EQHIFKRYAPLTHQPLILFSIPINLLHELYNNTMCAYCHHCVGFPHRSSHDESFTLFLWDYALKTIPVFKKITGGAL
ncbi:MAG: hypothetical protein WBB23_26125, partial [Desulforhopalus sp.]